MTPNKTKAKNSDIGTNTGLWLSSTSILVSHKLYHSAAADNKETASFQSYSSP